MNLIPQKTRTMKKLIWTIYILAAGQLWAKEHPSKVKSVTVYQTRAEITRTASLELTAGEQELVFPGISTLLDQNNIQVRGTGDLVILGTSFRRNFLNQNELPDDLQKIKDQIDALDMDIRRFNNYLTALDVERKLLDANMKVGGDEKLQAEELSELSAFYRKQVSGIANEQLNTRVEIEKTQKELQKLRAHYNDRTQAFRQNSGEIVVTVDVNRSTKANLEISYIVTGAGWRAEYDIRSADVNEPLELTYKAVITQNTGENWKDVELVLSTGNPNAGIIKPNMDPQYVDFISWRPSNSALIENRYKANDMRQAAPVMDLEETDVLEEVVIEDIAVASETRTMYTNYKVERPYSLSSGDKPLNVTIREQKVDADYEYQTVPKLRPRVFLIAKARNWGELVLLPGPINIFFEGGYVGKSYMDPNVTADELPISLGYDPGISIERKKLTDKSSKRTIGANKKETLVYEVSIRNNKSKDIKVVIQDQVPVSRNSEIRVENVESGGAVLNQNTGEVKWTVNLSSGQQVKKQFSFDVRYPKGKDISGL